MVDIKVRNLFFGQDSHSFVFSVNIPATYPNTPPFFDLHTLTGFKRDQVIWMSARGGEMDERWRRDGG